MVSTGQTGDGFGGEGGEIAQGLLLPLSDLSVGAVREEGGVRVVIVFVLISAM